MGVVQLAITSVDCNKLLTWPLTRVTFTLVKLQGPEMASDVTWDTFDKTKEEIRNLCGKTLKTYSLSPWGYQFKADVFADVGGRSVKLNDDGPRKFFVSPGTATTANALITQATPVSVEADVGVDKAWTP